MDIVYRQKEWTMVRFRHIPLEYVEDPRNAPEPYHTELRAFLSQIHHEGFCISRPKQTGRVVTAQLGPLWYAYMAPVILVFLIWMMFVYWPCNSTRVPFMIFVVAILLKYILKWVIWVESPVLTESLGETDMACMNQTRG
jgi:hypothetical protein